MKTFKDLVFENKYSDEMNKKFEKIVRFEEYITPIGAKLDFENGYSVSVISGWGSYTDNENKYELAVMYKNNVCYDTPITNDIIGHLTKRKVTNIMKKIQKLPSRNE